MEDIKIIRDEPESIREEELELFMVDDSTYKTTLTEKYRKKKPYEPVNLKIIRAAIPGIIRKLYVKEGAKVKKGDKLLVLEAMKMKNDIITIQGGTVATFCVKVGEKVSKDAILVKLK